MSLPEKSTSWKNLLVLTLSVLPQALVLAIHYNARICTFGSRCRYFPHCKFFHLCRDFVIGSCKFGYNCRYYTVYIDRLRHWFQLQHRISVTRWCQCWSKGKEVVDVGIVKIQYRFTTSTEKWENFFQPWKWWDGNFVHNLSNVITSTSL